MENVRSDFRQFMHVYRGNWKRLALTDVTYKVIAFVLLTPLVSLLLRAMLATSGKSVLADQDILFFLLGPAGWLCCILVGGASLGIVALEQAALLGVLRGEEEHVNVRLGDGLRFAARRAWPVLQVTARIVGWTLLVVAPFLVVAGLTYFLLLTEFDINYYLQEKPPVFLVAVGIGMLLATLLGAVLLRLFTGWFFAIPIVLLEDVRPGQVLRASGARSRGNRRTLLFWIVAWLLATTIVSGLATSLVLGAGQWIIPRSTGSLALLAVAVGLTLSLSAAVNLVLNLLSTTVFAVVLYKLYMRIGCPEGAESKQRGPILRSTTASGFQLTRTRLLAAAVVGVVAATAVGVAALESVPLVDNVIVIAHRGSSKAAPENTVAAVQQAIADGTDWVEIDVQETADGEVVVFHDSDFMKLAKQNLKIWNATMSDLEALDVGSWFGPEFKNERVPTLAQVLQECKGKCGVIIELKYYGHDQQLEQRVVDIVEANEMVRDVVIMSLKVGAVRKMKLLRPDWKVGLLMSVSAGNLDQSGANFLAVNAKFASRDFIASTQEQGRDVYAWTVNDAPTMSSLISRGVDGLITDHPATAKSVLAQRAELGPLERMLIELAGLLGVTPEIAEA